jgi:integrase
LEQAMPKLTDTFLKAFRPAPGAKDRLVFDTECRGLGVRASANGNRVFIVQWTDRATGRKQREPLGAWGSITIEQARTAARARLGRVAQGVNPATERSAARAEDQKRRASAAAAKEEARFTFDALISDWTKLHLAGKRERYATEAERALRLAFATHLSRPASAVTHATVIAVLDKLAGEGKAPIAGRTMAYGRACFGWAVKRRRLMANPFAGLPVIQGANPSRDRVLSDDEIGAVWRAAGAMGYPFGPLAQVLLLTAQRRDEVAGDAMVRTLTRPIDVDVARCPSEERQGAYRASRGTGAGGPGERPRIAGQDLVFSTTGTTPPSGFSKAKLALDAAIAREAGTDTDIPMFATGWRLHDFRRTAVTWLAGAGFPPHVADRLLNHVSGSIQGVAAIYQRNEFLAERKAALEAWSAHVLQCSAGSIAACRRAGRCAGGAASLNSHIAKIYRCTPRASTLYRVE